MMFIKELEEIFCEIQSRMAELIVVAGADSRITSS
jgi:hypothetical protein